MANLCLFSFEIYVEKVTYNHTSHYPAVSFRLFDFPSVIIYQNTVNNEPESTVDSSSISFKKGKSCLFKYDFQELETLIEKVPLYVMLVDFYKEKPKHLGSCLVPINSLLHQIKTDPKNKNFESPSCGEGISTYKLFNLMSTIVGSLTLKMKLICFGKSLLNHVQVKGKEKPKIDVLLKLHDLDLVSNDKEKSPVEIDHTILPASGSKEYEGNKLDKSKGKKIFFDKAIQCSKTKKIKSTNVFNNKENNSNPEAVFNNNIFCPPPLFMNINIEEKNNFCSAVKTEKKYILENDFLNDYDDLSPDEEPYMETIEPCKKIVNRNNKKHQKYLIHNTENLENENNEYAKGKHIAAAIKDTSYSEIKEVISKKNLSELPVLNSMLKELLTLVDGVKIPDEKESTRDIHEKSNSDIKPTKIESVDNDLKNDIQIVDMKSKDITKEKKKSVSLKKDGEKLPKKGRKYIKGVSYGLTRTQKMRYRMTHPNVKLPQDGRDLHKKRSHQAPLSKECSLTDHTSNEHGKDIDRNIVTVDSIDEKENEDNDLKASKDSRIYDRRPSSINVISPIYERRRNSISIVIPSPEHFIQNSIEGSIQHSSSESEADNKEFSMNQAGFYSPQQQEEKKITTSAFDDTEPWSSTKDIDKVNDYDNDSFDSHSDKESVLSGTSSVSLPKGSHGTEQTNSDSLDQNSDFSNKEISHSRAKSRLARKTNSNYEGDSYSEKSKLSTHRTSSRQLSSRMSTKRNNSPYRSNFSPVKSKNYKEQSSKNKKLRRSVSNLSSYSYSNISNISGLTGGSV